MDELLALSAVLDEIDGDSFENLEGRVAFQKRIYLVQAAGVPLGYGFKWNQYGPYSPRLAEEGRRLELAEMVRTSKKPEFTEEAHKAFARYRMLTELPDEDVPEGPWLEILSSMLFLVNNGVGAERDEEHVKDRLRTLKPYLGVDDDVIDAAWERVRSFNEPAMV